MNHVLADATGSQGFAANVDDKHVDCITNDKRKGNAAVREAKHR